MSKVYEKFENLTGNAPDVRSRRYITPSRIVWDSSSEGAKVENTQTLLVPKDKQITLSGGPVCTLRNESGKPHASVLVDFGREIHGALRVYIFSVEGEGNRANINIRLGESAQEAYTQLGVKNTTNDHANRDVVWNVGFLSSMETNESGFRFACIELLDENAAIGIKAIDGVFIFRDIDYIGSFECSDPLLNKIWDTAAYTAHLNMQEYLWDGIKRDRLVWIGDMHTEVMTISSVFGYNEVVPKSLDIVRDETPVGHWMNGISSYSIWWLLIQYDWYMSFGNIEYLKEQAEYLHGLLNVLCDAAGEDGSEHMPEGRFIDWPNANKPEAIHAGLQGLLKIALERGGELLTILGDDETACKCSAGACRLAKHIPDPAGSKQAASFLVLSGLRDAKEINDSLISVGGAHGYSTFLGFYTLAAKAMAGDYQGALDAMREYWGGMLKMGATTFWEDFDLDWMNNAAPITELVPEGKIDIHGDFGNYCYVKFRHSLCHGWSSGPVPFMSKYIMGVEILEPGCKKLAVRPHLGDLSFVRGTFPTPYGKVSVFAAKMDDGSVKLEVNAPDEVEIVK